MKWAEKFPHPGDPPPTPGDKPPYARTGEPGREAVDAWWKVRHSYEDWLQKSRLHIVAQSIDDLVSRPQLTSAENITMILGLTYLEQGGAPSAVSSLFGIPRL